jgi:hypothetical protein
MSNGDDESSTTSTLRIAALRGSENVLAWEQRMKQILNYYELAHTVDFAYIIPTDATGAATYQCSSTKALARISCTVTDDVLTYISEATTALEAWKTIQHTFKPHGILAICNARREFYATMCAEGADVAEHIRTLIGHRRTLVQLGAGPTDADYAITILTSLPESWRPFIQTLDANNAFTATPVDSGVPGVTGPLYPPTDARMTAEELIQRIMDEHRRRSMRDDADVAAAAVTKGKKPGFGKAKNSGSGDASGNTKAKDRKDEECYRCGEKGHRASICPAPAPKSKATTAPKAKSQVAAAAEDVAAASISDFALITIDDSE